MAATNLPPLNRYVLAHIVGRPWESKFDPDGVFFKVVRLEQSSILNGDGTPNFYYVEFGPDRYELNEVDFWFDLPRQ